MIEYLNNLDTTIFLTVNGAHSPFFDSFMTMFTGRFIWIPMYAMVLWILFRNCRWQRAAAYLVALGVAILLTDQTCASLIRPAVERLRPSNLENTLSQYAYIVNGYRGGAYGFPSCHAANSFALAVFITLFVKQRGFTIFIMGWAILNSYSRLYLGVHYPGDLIVGAAVGSAFGAICYGGARMLATRIPILAGEEAPVKLKQLTPGATLRTLTPVDASLFPTLSMTGDTHTPSRSGGSSPAGLLTNVAGADLMIAAFAITLAIIIITSALN